MRKRKYTVECLQQIGLQSAQKFKKSLPLHVLELADIKCDYLASSLNNKSTAPQDSPDADADVSDTDDDAFDDADVDARILFLRKPLRIHRIS